LAEPVFLDTNVLVYLNDDGAPLHARAAAIVQRLDEDGARLWVSRQVFREYLAVVTRPPQGAYAPASPEEAIEDVRAFEARFAVAEDGPFVTARLLDLLQRVPLAGRQVHDANIVATMEAHGLRRLLTFSEADFRRFASDEAVELVPLDEP
jgi:predicted nucleic acid-binding protein